jgi:hypothetical protein
VLWGLVAVSMGVAALSGAMLHGVEAPDDTTRVVFWSSFGVGALGLLAEARRDLFTVLAVLCVVDVFVVMGAVGIALGTPAPTPVATAVAVASSVFLVAAFGYLIRDQYFRSGPPDVLRARFPKGEAFELDGVQLAVWAAPDALEAGQAFTVTVAAQNCWDQPRTLVLGLEPKHARRGRALRFARTAQLRLGGAEVGLLHVPVSVMAEAMDGAYALRLHPRVEGAGGARVRRRRGRAVPERVPAWRTVVGLALGELVWGDGITTAVQVRGRDGPAEPWASAPAVWSELIWPAGLSADDPPEGKLDAPASVLTGEAGDLLGGADRPR